MHPNSLHKLPPELPWLTEPRQGRLAALREDHAVLPLGHLAGIVSIIIVAVLVVLVVKYYYLVLLLVVVVLLVRSSGVGHLAGGGGGTGRHGFSSAGAPCWVFELGAHELKADNIVDMCKFHRVASCFSPAEQVRRRLGEETAGRAILHDGGVQAEAAHLAEEPGSGRVRVRETRERDRRERERERRGRERERERETRERGGVGGRFDR